MQLSMPGMAIPVLNKAQTEASGCVPLFLPVWVATQLLQYCHLLQLSCTASYFTCTATYFSFGLHSTYPHLLEYLLPASLNSEAGRQCSAVHCSAVQCIALIAH